MNKKVGMNPFIIFLILLLFLFDCRDFREQQKEGGMSLRAYSSVIYNALGDVWLNSQAITYEDIRGLGRRVYQSGHSDEVCVVIAHRHFDLGPDEVMFEYAGTNGERIAEPRPLKEVLASENAQPNVLSCSPDGYWYPTSYEKVDKEIKAWKDEKFLGKAARYLKHNGLTSKLGLATRRSKSEGEYFVEENLVDKRQSITRISTKEQVAKAVPTTYCFARGESKVTQSCEVCGACIVHGENRNFKQDAYPPGEQPSHRIDALPSTFILSSPTITSSL